jgi:lysozyme
MIPKAKPKIGYDDCVKILKANGVDISKEKMCLLGVRGYYLNSMGLANKNDIGIYDDALIWLDEQGIATFNGNTDPSRHYANVATLKLGRWRYKKGPHGISRGNPYPAFRQAADVTVQRFQSKRGGEVTYKDDTGYFAINIHRGGNTTTSSAGCQTIPPGQWDAFRAYGYMLIDRYKKKDFVYLLVGEAS